MADAKIREQSSSENPTVEIYELAQKVQGLSRQITSLRHAIYGEIDQMGDLGDLVEGINHVCNYVDLVERCAAEAEKAGEKIETLVRIDRAAMARLEVEQA